MSEWATVAVAVVGSMGTITGAVAAARSAIKVGRITAERDDRIADREDFNVITGALRTDLEDVRTELRETRAQLRAAVNYIQALTTELRRNDIQPPPLPVRSSFPWEV